MNIRIGVYVSLYVGLGEQFMDQVHTDWAVVQPGFFKKELQ